MIIFLIGMPSAGKSTQCKILSAKLGMQAFDTDVEISERYGSIAEIFENSGEEYFRDIETRTLKLSANFQNVVVATGGGVVERRENIAFMRPRGKIIYLSVSQKTLLSRLKDDTSRPLLAGDTRKRLNELYSRRQKLYQGAADITVEAEGSPEDIAEEIIKKLGYVL